MGKTFDPTAHRSVGWPGATPRQRYNWGYWDGRMDAELGRTAPWNTGRAYMARHPFDPVYGDAYWHGQHDQVHFVKRTSSQLPFELYFERTCGHKLPHGNPDGHGLDKAQTGGPWAAYATGGETWGQHPKGPGGILDTGQGHD